MGLLDGATNVEELETQEPAQEPAPDPTPQADVIVAPPKPPGRRAAAAAALEAVTSKLDDIGKQFGEYRTATEARMAQMHGALEAYQRQPPQVVYQPPPTHQQQGPDPAQLRREAMTALDNKDFNRYQDLSHEAAVVEAERRVLSKIPQQQAPQGNPQLQSAMVPLFAAHPDVAKHPRHMALLNAKAAELLEGRGMQPGPETLALVFEEVNAQIQAQRKGSQPTYSRQAAAAITSSPSNRTVAAPATEGQVNLSEIARKHGVSVDSMKTWARKAGMTLEEYAAGLPR